MRKRKREIFFALNAVENCEKICAPTLTLPLSVDPLTSKIRVDFAAAAAAKAAS